MTLVTINGAVRLPWLDRYQRGGEPISPVSPC